MRKVLLIALVLGGLPLAAAPAQARPPAGVAPVLTDLAFPATRVAAGPITLSRPDTVPFSAVGVSWTGDGPRVTVQLRTKRPGGAWTAWSTTGTDDKAPDTERGSRGGTEPVWTGPATGVEARVTAATTPADLRLTLIDPGTAATDAAPTPGVGQPGVYPRSAWGADPALMGWDPEYAPAIKAGFLHHTDTTNAYTAAEVPAILRSIYAFHAVTRGWGDIGYNFLVDRFGRTWEGRAGGIASTVIGAHTGGFNTGTFGVAMIGDFTSAPVPAATTAAVSKVFAWKLGAWGLSPYGTATLTSLGGGTSRYPAGATVTENVISGHRDVGSTTCPGDKGYATLALVRAQVRDQLKANPTASHPTVTPATVPYGSAGGVRITAGLVGTSKWSVTVTRDCPAAAVRSWTGTGAVDTTWTPGVLRPGTYTVAVRPNGTGAPVTTRLTVLPPPAVPPVPGVLPTADPAGFVPVPPARLADTRTGLPVGGATRLDVPVLGRGGVPATGVAAVMLSVTGLCAGPAGPLTVYPAGAADPGSTTVSVPGDGVPRAALAVVPVGAGGRITVAGGATATDVLVDVVGYLPVSGGAGFHPEKGTRVLDGTIMPGRTAPVSVTGTTALLADLGVGVPVADGTLHIWPADRPMPRIANLAYRKGVVTSGKVAVSTAGRKLLIRNDGPKPVRVTLDVTGWWGGGGSRFTAVAPTRLTAPALKAGVATTVPVAGRAGVPAGAEAVVVSLSARSTAASWQVAWAEGARPPTADLHTPAGAWGTTLAVIPLAADGTVRLWNATGTGTALLDVVGYYGAPPG